MLEFQCRNCGANLRGADPDEISDAVHAHASTLCVQPDEAQYHLTQDDLHDLLSR